jgi:hypothetical protein
MIEKLLSRIARRSPLPSPLLVVEPIEQGALPQLSSTGALDPFSTPYPAPGRVRSVRSGQTVPGPSNAWLIACDAYISRRHGGAPIADQPAYFADWGMAHMAVAQMLWAQREQLSEGDEVHIRSSDALLAVFLPLQRRVFLHAAAYEPRAPLALHLLRAGHSSGLAQGNEYVSYSLYSLLWFYGQVYSDAPDLLPEEIGMQLIQLRRFPLVEPAALEMRHLALIHVFSGGALSFTQLQKQIPQEHASSLCADLASLYFTGALRLLP